MLWRPRGNTSDCDARGHGFNSYNWRGFLLCFFVRLFSLLVGWSKPICLKTLPFFWNACSFSIRLWPIIRVSRYKHSLFNRKHYTKHLVETSLIMKVWDSSFVKLILFKRPWLLLSVCCCKDVTEYGTSFLVYVFYTSMLLQHLLMILKQNPQTFRICQTDIAMQSSYKLIIALAKKLTIMQNYHRKLTRIYMTLPFSKYFKQYTANIEIKCYLFIMW